MIIIRFNNKIYFSMKYLITFISFFVFAHINSFSQFPPIEIYIIDAYVTLEKPYILKLSFFTSEETKSVLHFNDEEYAVSDTYSEDHEFELNMNTVL